MSCQILSRTHTEFKAAAILKNLSREEIERRLSKLNSFKTSGADEVSTYLVKMGSKKLLKAINKVISIKKYFISSLFLNEKI